MDLVVILFVRIMVLSPFIGNAINDVAFVSREIDQDKSARLWLLYSCHLDEAIQGLLDLLLLLGFESIEGILDAREVSTFLAHLAHQVSEGISRGRGNSRHLCGSSNFMPSVSRVVSGGHNGPRVV